MGDTGLVEASDVSDDHPTEAGSAARRPRLTRRQVLATSAVVSAGALLTQDSPPRAGNDDEHWWLGPELWGNRLADWTRRGGEVLCVAAAHKRRLCTASMLTRSLDGGRARISVELASDVAGKGFAGFLLGTGVDEEHRRTALVATASGTGGGTLAVLGYDGRVGFRDHTDEAEQLAFTLLPSKRSPRKRSGRPGEWIRLTLEVVPDASDADPTASPTVALLLTAVTQDGSELSRALWEGVDRDVVAGGLALASSSQFADGPRYAFRDLTSSGDGVLDHPERAVGPIVGTLFSLSAGILKMTAQVFPSGRAGDDTVTLETQSEDGGWAVRVVAPVGVGYAAALRVADWDGARATPYRVSHSRGGESWGGTIPAEPTGDRPVTIATVSCSKSSHRTIDAPTDPSDGLAGGSALSLYGPENVWFPYERSLAAVTAHEPDVLVAMGDQYYETSPTRADPSTHPELDFYYKYLQWLWSVRELTRNRPTLVLVDDHDVFQGNLYGEGGIAAPFGDFKKGGYSKRADWVNLVQRVQCGHNPDPVDPAPIEQGIDVYFTRFDYAGITFVIVEDRKFRTSPDGIDGKTSAPRQLLGQRQEAMLDRLAADKRGTGSPVVVLTQTVYATVETDPSGALINTFSPGGFPKEARNRALASIKDAGAVMLSGDTHLASLVRHLGLEGGAEGPLQFTGPAVASSYQRWFTPSAALAEPGVQPFTGRATDKSGAEFVVLAIANPTIDQADVVSRPAGHNLGYRGFKSEGYGLVVVDAAQRTYRFEAWSGDVDPLVDGAAPYPGWPYTLSFDDA